MRKTGAYLMILAAFLLTTSSHTEAAVHTEKVNYKSGEVSLQGYLAYDDSSKGERPGVLVVHEWWGLNDHAKRKAEALAKAGYIAFAVDMYGEGKNTAHPDTAGKWSAEVRQNKQLGKERFLASYEVLKNHRLTKKKHIAAIGYCFGGYVVLAMAQEGLDLRGVASFHGALPAERVDPGSIKAKILVLHGAEDPLVKPEQISQYQENLKHAGADWQFVFYGGTKHSFTNPDADKAGMPALAYNRSADRRSWTAMLAFFKEIFGKG
jgi:dienelactone hydrolase